jgi:hypothetical protein
LFCFGLSMFNVIFTCVMSAFVLYCSRAMLQVVTQTCCYQLGFLGI